MGSSIDITPGPTTFALRCDVTDYSTAQFGQNWKGLGGATYPTKPTVVETPKTYSLGANYPNPFNPDTNIAYQLPEATHVRLEVFNINGQRVRLILDEARTAGFHIAQWDGRNDLRSPVASGLYVYRFTAGAFVDQKKMALLK